MSDRLQFKPKIDLWILIVLLGAVAACLVIAAQLWPAVIGSLWWIGVPLLAGIALPLWILLTTRYALSDSELFVSCGPFRWAIAIGDIEKVAPVTDLASSPSLSSDRVRIDYAGGRSVRISPEPRKAFLQQLDYRRRQAEGSAQSAAS